MIVWLEPDDPFPPPSSALTDPNGLLAAGADLSPARLLAAYRRGIFPWFNEGDPPLWWSPDPRTVIRPADFHISHSLRKRLRQGCFEVSSDRDFIGVVNACATTPRRGQTGTWITPSMQLAYRRLHELGYAHSVEIWQQQKLVGGVYGVAVGRAFFAESMFSRCRDASKVALAHLCRSLAVENYRLMDCQMPTDHLHSLGAIDMRRDSYVAEIALAVDDGPPQDWPAEQIGDPF